MRQFLLSILFCCAFSFLGFAQQKFYVVELNGGKVVSGIVLQETDEFVKLQTSVGNSRIIYLKDIANIDASKKPGKNLDYVAGCASSKPYFYHGVSIKYCPTTLEYFNPTSAEVLASYTSHRVSLGYNLEYSPNRRWFFCVGLFLESSEDRRFETCFEYTGDLNNDLNYLANYETPPIGWSPSEIRLCDDKVYKLSGISPGVNLGIKYCFTKEGRKVSPYLGICFAFHVLESSGLRYDSSNTLFDNTHSWGTSVSSSFLPQMLDEINYRSNIQNDLYFSFGGKIISGKHVVDCSTGLGIAMLETYSSDHTNTGINRGGSGKKEIFFPAFNLVWYF